MSHEPEFPEEAAPAERPSEMRFAEYWETVVKHRRLIFVCVGAALAVAALVSILSKPTYRASVVLAVEKERASPLDPNWKPQVYAGADAEFLPTQIQVMRSREIAERVVQRLGLADHPELNPRKSGLFRASRKGKSGSGRSDTIRVAKQIRADIEVAPIRGTSLVELSYLGPSPKLTGEIANALAEAYIAWNLEAKFQILGQAAEFLTAQIEQVRNEIGAKERQLLAYGRQKDILSAEPGSNVTIQKLGALNSDYAAAVAARVGKEARYHQLRNARSDTIAEVAAIGTISQLRSDQAKLEREYAEKLNVFKPEWPAMQQLKVQIEKGRQHLDAVIEDAASKAREAAKTDYLAAQRLEESFRGVLQTQKSEVQAMNTNAVEYNSLRTEIETKKSMLDSLLKRLAETQVISRMGAERASSNIRIVDRALPPSSPFRPSYKLNALIGLLGGGVLGVGLALFLSYLDRSLRTVEQVEHSLRLPALGVIPAVGPKGRGYAYIYGSKPRRAKKGEEQPAIELLPHQHPRSRVAERYRGFRTALLLSRAGGVRSIVITSSFSREGKTATAVNLAIVLGQLGKRVLLVDADLHRPRMHEILRISNRTGLVSILAENLEPARAIVKTDLPEVFVVPSGPSSPNPSGLLSSEAMGKFLALAQVNFDFLVLDAPPVAAVADALVLGHQADGVVLCVKGGETPREHVARVRDKLIQSNVRILGVLINDLVEDEQAYGARYAYDASYYGREPLQTEPKAQTL